MSGQAMSTEERNELSALAEKKENGTITPEELEQYNFLFDTYQCE